MRRGLEPWQTMYLQHFAAPWIHAAKSGDAMTHERGGGISAAAPPRQRKQQQAIHNWGCSRESCRMERKKEGTVKGREGDEEEAKTTTSTEKTSHGIAPPLTTGQSQTGRKTT